MDKNLAYYLKYPEKAMEISESDMKAWLEQYPYSAAVHMLRARKSLDGLAPSSKNDIIKAADYVSDPLFLYYQLLKDEEKEVETMEAIRQWKKEPIPTASSEESKEEEEQTSDITAERTTDLPAQSIDTEPGEKSDVSPSEEESSKAAPSQAKPQPEATKAEAKAPRKAAGKAESRTPKVKDKAEAKPKPVAKDRAKKEEVVKEALKAKRSAPLTFSTWLNSLEPIEEKAKPETANKPKKKKVKKSGKKKKSRLEKLISQSIAEKEEAISETYADLLISQGYTEKAKEVLRKLVLKFPEKSGYFAAKIENLDKE